MPKKYDFENQKYSEEEIRGYLQKYPEEFNRWLWLDISEYQNLSEGFIREFQDRIDWYWISGYQILSEEFIREFQDEVWWVAISEYQTLSENFIREFQDKVDLDWVSAFQNLSEKFLIEFIDKIEIGNDEIYGLKNNKKISEKVKNRIINLKKVQNA